jgi:hypothetical protein
MAGDVTLSWPAVESLVLRLLRLLRDPELRATTPGVRLTVDVPPPAVPDLDRMRLQVAVRALRAVDAE